MNLTLHLMKLVYMTIREKALTLLKKLRMLRSSIVVDIAHYQTLHSVDAIINKTEVFTASKSLQ